MSNNQVRLHSIFLGVCAGLLTSCFGGFYSFLFAFFSTSVVYLFLRKKREEKTNILSKGIEAILVIGTFLSFLFLNNESKLSATVGGFVVLAYHTPFQFSLRRIVLLKPIAISLCWALATVIIPFLQEEVIPIDYSVSYETVAVFVLTFYLSLLYDWRDVYHNQTDIKTIAHCYSQKQIQKFYLAAILIFFTIAMFINTPIEFLICLSLAISYGFGLSIFIERISFLHLTWLIDGGFLFYVMLKNLLTPI